MNEMPNNWDDFRLFLAVARTKGLSPAAQITGRSPATLGRRMLGLERKLGMDLFIRHDRGYELTGNGAELLGKLEGVEDSIVQLTTRSDHKRLPLVKVSAGTWTTLALIDELNTILGTPVDVQLRFVSAENLLDISHREVPIGFRNRRPVEANLAGRKLCRVEFAPYSVAAHPKRWIKVIADTPSARWLHKMIGDDAVCEVNTPRNSLDLAIQGVGIALLPTFIGDKHPDLERCGAIVSELSHDQWLVTHQDDRYLPEVRRVIDRMCKILIS